MTYNQLENIIDFRVNFITILSFSSIKLNKLGLSLKRFFGVAFIKNTRIRTDGNSCCTITFGRVKRSITKRIDNHNFRGQLSLSGAGPRAFISFWRYQLNKMTV